VMKRDINMVKSLGANGIVIGALTKDHTMDDEVLTELLAVTDSLDVTIHRAFDFARDQKEALLKLAEYKQITTILTAGGNYRDTEAVEQINELIAMASETHLSIMTGHGLRLDTFETFYEATKPEYVHFGTGARINESFDFGLDKSKIKEIN